MRDVCPSARGRVGAGIFLAALASALLFAWAFPLPPVRNDAVEYLALARNIAAGNGFSTDGIHPAVYRPPLFSLLLGGWFLLTGTSSALSAAVFQSLEHAAGVWFAFLLFLEFAPSLAWAAAGGLFLALNPLLFTRVAFVLQEPTLLLFTTAAGWASVRLLREPSPVRAALTGTAWGLCTLAKVVSWFVPLLFPALLLLPGRLRRKLRGAEIAVLLACFAGVVAPWTARNAAQFHRFIPVNDQGRGMLEWNVKQAKIPGERPGSEFLADLNARGLPEPERKQALRQYVLDRPWHFFVRRVAWNALSFGAPPRGWWDARGYMRPGEHTAAFWILSLLFHVPLYVLLLVRTREWWRGGASPPYGFLVLLYWSYWAEHALIWGDPRFGLAVYPVLVAIALPLGRKETAGVRTGRTPAPA